MRPLDRQSCKFVKDRMLFLRLHTGIRPSPHGQGTSKHAENRRIKAAQKAARSGKTPPTQCSASIASLNTGEGDGHGAKPAPSSSMASSQGLTITEDEDVKVGMVPKTSTHVKHGITVQSTSRDIARRNTEHLKSQERGSQPILEKGDVGKDFEATIASGISLQSSPKPLVRPSIAPEFTKTWADICFSEPIVRKISPPLQRKDIWVTTPLSPQTQPTATNFISVPAKPGDINVSMNRESERTNVSVTNATVVQGTLSSPAEKVKASAYNSNDVSSVVLSPFVHAKAVNSNVPPQSSSQSSTSFSTSNAKSAQSFPSSKSMSAATTITDVPPQPSGSPEDDLSSTPSSVVEQPLDNLFVMIRQQRQALLAGPLVTLYVNESVITGVYKRVAMVVSRVLNEHFTANPESTEYRFVTDVLAPEAIRYLLVSWVGEVSQEFEAYAVPMQDTFGKNVALLRAARFLGMEQYTKHILTEHVNYLMCKLPSYEEIAIVERHATSSRDPLWTKMVNHLCHERYKNLLPDPEIFAAFLEKHPRLEKAMHEADTYFAAAARKRWEAKKVERQERIFQEQQASEPLKQNMDERGQLYDDGHHN
jgi:hypothetical protein